MQRVDRSDIISIMFALRTHLLRSLVKRSLVFLSLGHTRRVRLVLCSLEGSRAVYKLAAVITVSPTKTGKGVPAAVTVLVKSRLLHGIAAAIASVHQQSSDMPRLRTGKRPC